MATAPRTAQRPGPNRPDTPAPVEKVTLVRSRTRGYPLYQQIADDIIARIRSGELPPDTPLPSESEMELQYDVSRAPIRQAMQLLRMTGYVITEHGRATRVRPAPDAVTLDIDTTVIRKRQNYWTWDSDPEWRETGETHKHRADAGHYSEDLGINPKEPLFTYARVLHHNASRARATHCLLVPFSVASGTILERLPHVPARTAYRALADAGHTPAWFDTITASIPTPDDVEALDMPPGAVITIHTRITTDGPGGRPLILEESRFSSSSVALVSSQDKPVRG
jgi:GntR family transcriptional regulator